MPHNALAIAKKAMPQLDWRIRDMDDEPVRIVAGFGGYLLFVEPETLHCSWRNIEYTDIGSFKVWLGKLRTSIDMIFPAEVMPKTNNPEYMPEVGQSYMDTRINRRREIEKIDEDGTIWLRMYGDMPRRRGPGSSTMALDWMRRTWFDSDRQAGLLIRIP